MIKSFDELVSIEDRDIVTCDVKAWGKSVNIRPLSSEQAEKITVRFSGVKDDSNSMVGMRTALIRMSLVDSEGNLMITTDEQAEQLGSKSSDAIKEIFEFCMELNGFNSKAEDLEKN